MNLQQKKMIEKLYLEMYKKLMLYARRNLENDMLAEEAVHETFRIACEKPENLCNSDNAQGWLVLTLQNVIRNMNRNRETAKRIMEQYLTAQLKEAAVTEDRFDLNLLYANVTNSEEFKLLAEIAIEGKSHREMAQSRGITINACKKRVQRAKEILKAKI